jgi:chitodextrinase
MVAVSYNAGLGRYLLATEFSTSSDGNLGIFDAPEPWGPWTTVTYQREFGGGHCFYYNFSNKWLSPDGKDFTLIYTGVGTEDAWHTVRGRFTTSTSSDDENPPTDPSGLTIAGATESSISLSWSASSDAEGSTPIAYQVENVTDADLSSWITTTTYTASGLLAGRSYTFRVKARDTAGNESAWSAPVTGTTDLDGNDPPNRPTDVAATVLGSTSVRLGWTGTGDPDGDPVQYYVEEVYSTQITSGWLPVGTTTWTATGLEPGTTYKFQVRGRDDASPPAYSPWVRANTVTTDDPAFENSPPLDPTNVVADALGTTSIAITWTHNGDPDGHPVEYYVREINNVNIASGWLEPGVSSWTATNLVPETTYQFEVKGRDPHAPPYTNWVRSNSETTGGAGPNDPPHRPSNFWATVLGSDAVSFTWTDNGDPDGDPVQFYIEEVYNVRINSGWLDAGVTTWTATGLEPGTTYKFQVRARDDAVPPAYSSWVRANTVTTFEETEIAGPVAVSTTLQGGVVRIEWKLPDNLEIAGVHVYRRSSGGEPERLTSEPATGDHFEDTAAIEGEGYHYWVTAVTNDGTESGATEPAWLRTTPDIPSRLMIERVYPSPVRDEVTFRVGIPEAGPEGGATAVTVDFYDLAGKKLGRVFDEPVSPGVREIRVRLSSAGLRPSPGIYLAFVRAGSQELVHRLAIAAE